MCMVDMIKKNIEDAFAGIPQTIADEAAKGNLDLSKLEGEVGEKIKSLLAADGPTATVSAPQKSMASMDARRRRLMRRFQYGMMSTIKPDSTPGAGPANPGSTPFPIVNQGKPIIGKIL